MYKEVAIWLGEDSRGYSAKVVEAHWPIETDGVKGVAINYKMYANDPRYPRNGFEACRMDNLPNEFWETWKLRKD